MSNFNSVTGDKLISKVNSKEFDDNYDLAFAKKPVPMQLNCPSCLSPHIDEGEWATKPHKTHQCQNCGYEWKPFDYATVGIEKLYNFKESTDD